MSDYFGKLAVRTIADAPRIQPRPVSLFEPARPASIPDISQSQAADNGSAGASPAPAVFADSAGTTTTAQPQISANVIPNVASRSAARSVADPGPPRRDLRSTGAHLEALSPEAEGHRPTHVSAASMEPDVVRAATTAASSVTPTSAPMLSRSVLSIGEEIRMVSNPAVGAPLLSRESSPQMDRSVLSPPGMPAIERPSEPNSAESGSERTIRVTIGRIEVRAVSPAPSLPVARKKTAAPKVSLEDYLKRSPEGRR